MNIALLQFRENLQRDRELGHLAASVQRMTTVAVDVTDIWRAQVVLAVSALDYFIHELTRMGMIECAKGARPKTEAFLRFELPLSSVDSALSGSSHDAWIGDSVRTKHAWLSFQDPDKLADAIRLISPVPLWERVGAELSTPAKAVKIRLKLIVDRRNKIAHEADQDPANPGFRWAIDSALANDTIDFISSLGEAIYRVAV